MKSVDLEIGPPRSEDYTEWRHLFQGYADFYRVPMNDEIAARVWRWLFDPNHPLEALIARENGKMPVGLAHYRPMPSPLRGIEIGFLDDLFVNPQHRGHKIGEQLLDRLAHVARKKGWPTIRWITQEHNYRARTLYDQHASRTEFLTYQMTVPRD